MAFPFDYMNIQNYNPYGYEDTKGILPYYMKYPMQDFYSNEEENDRDIEYIKGLYPEKMRQIQDIIEDECDKLEYEGSMMFDECPDKLMLRTLSNQIYEKTQDLDVEDIYEATQLRREYGGRHPGLGGYHSHHQRPQNDWKRDIISVLLFNEFFQRRCRYRNCRGRRWRY
ncbi:MAG: hypothetical protein GX913_06975 [Clostridiales bacterium]|nr:hypothetical protein [Clostridiales bacterium]